MVYRVGIVGAGENARDHGRACRHVEQAELVTICDVSKEALTRYGDEFGVSRRYTRLEEMLDQEELDIVVVSTWGVFHAEVSKTVARSGKARAILVEKPISATAAECEEMIAAAHENGVLLTEAFKWRHDPQHLRIKELIDAGRIGPVMSVHSTFSSPLVRFAQPTNWRYYRERGGGSVFDTAGYLIHFARHVIGAEPHRVYASGSFIKSSNVEMSAAILLEFPDGATANLTSSYQYGYCQATEILGTHGWIRMDLPFDQRSVREQEFVEKEDLPASVRVFHDNFDTEIYHFSPANQFDLQLRHLCECLDAGTPHRIPVEFSLGNMRVIDAVHKSIQTRMPVDLPVVE
ncbi:Gfo/Idh/MocA family protein [Candidatus Entotheonella palauensis]|uniref:Gfo/Idh/MocA family protein n=1 Tax=Candidatus Entotheonella palauensis TaxID=93172 RepID=UPI000B7F193C|nr:Gfo/Idh/MocA family oxidoreductase [Candidatus Entotheonella palauensis]